MDEIQQSILNQLSILAQTVHELFHSGLRVNPWLPYSLRGIPHDCDRTLPHAVSVDRAIHSLLGKYIDFEFEIEDATEHDHAHVRYHLPVQQGDLGLFSDQRRTAAGATLT